MCQKELVDGFVQLVCRWGAGGNRAETYRAHTLTLIPEFPDTENSAWSYRSVCSQRQRVDYKDRCPMVLQESFPMIQVSIPSMEKEVDESGKTKKLFRIEVLFNERKHFVLRRNSEFQNLHRKLRKIVQTPDFPSKRNQHLRTKPPEQRRQELEDYVQDVIYQYEDVPQVLLDFLHVRHFHTGNKSSMESLDELDSQDDRWEYYCYQFTNQRVLGFFQDPYLTDSTSGRVNARHGEISFVVWCFTADMESFFKAKFVLQVFQMWL
uniref:PX domain-containing protein n=1 Tax=Astatotilapia calliptera TaxID=8154 RepID=A0AAX7VBX8_ASTCA